MTDRRYDAVNKNEYVVISDAELYSASDKTIRFSWKRVLKSYLYKLRVHANSHAQNILFTNYNMMHILLNSRRIVYEVDASSMHLLSNNIFVNNVSTTSLLH